MQVKLTAVTGATPKAGLTVTFDEPSLPAASKTVTYDNRVHYDEVGTGVATDTFDANIATWTSGLINRVPAWTPATEKLADGSLNRYMHVPDLGVASDIEFTTPWMQINPSGNTVLSFKYRQSLEGTIGSNGFTAPFYDGVVLEVTIDDITWYDFYLDLGINPGYTAFLELGDNPLADRAAFVGTNLVAATGLPKFPELEHGERQPGHPVDGLPVRLRWRIGSDSGVGAYGFDLDDVRVTNVKAAPFSGVIAETSDGTTCNRKPVADVGQTPRSYNEFDVRGTTPSSR